MKCLSLWQPHAIAIGLGIKPYETRGWDLAQRFPEVIGVPVAIHASKKEFRERDYAWPYFKECRERLNDAGVQLRDLDYGKVICICTFTASLRTRTIREKWEVPHAPEPKWAFWGDFSDRGDDNHERFAFKVADVRLIPGEHRPSVVGRQGFFNLSTEVSNELALWG